MQTRRGNSQLLEARKDVLVCVIQDAGAKGSDLVRPTDGKPLLARFCYVLSCSGLSCGGLSCSGLSCGGSSSALWGSGSSLILGMAAAKSAP